MVVDTLRADHLGAYGYARETTPAIDARIDRARVFERAFAASPWTLPSFVSLLTAQWPARVVDLEIRGLSGLDPAVPMLAERLRDAGLRTIAVTNNALLHPRLGFGRGFDEYDWKTAGNRRSRRAGEVVARALELIDAGGGRPFFALVHVFDPHMDYDPEASVRGRFTSAERSDLGLPVTGMKEIRAGAIVRSEADRDFVRAAYDEEVLAVDAALAQLFAGLEARGLMESALVVLTADHGEELFEHGGFEHGHAMWQELLHVPLVVWGRGVAPGRDRLPVSHVDVLPTVLEAVGAPVPPALAGRSLWPRIGGAAEPDVRDGPIYAEGLVYASEAKSIVRWPWKLVLHLDDERVELYDLASDPGERNDLAAQRPDEREALLAELRDWTRAAAALDPDRAPIELDAETRDSLRQLGYIE